MPNDIVIIIGQSNAVGRTADDAGAYYPAGTMNYTTAGAWAAISKRVLHGSVEAAASDTTFAFDRQFAIDYVADNPTSTLYFIGAAEGGTGFAPGDWVSGGATYNRAVARINAAIAAAPGGSVLKGFLWHQGERDGQNDTDATAYAARLLQFIDDFRGDITGGASVPFVLGGIGQQSSQFNAKVMAAILGVSNTKLLTGYAAADFIAEATFGDGVHFDAASTRALGTQYNLAFKRAALNTSLGGGGSVTLGTPVTANFSSGSSVTATGVALGAAAADRLMLVGITSRTSGSACRVKNASLAGVPLTRIVAASTLVAGGNITNWYYARIPTGTTGDLAVTFGSSAVTNQVGYIVIPAYGARDPIGNVKGHGSLGGGNTYGTSISVNVDVQAGDLLVAQASAQQTAAPSVTLNVTGATSRALGTNVTNAYAYEQITADSTRTVTADFSGVTVNNPSVNAFTLRPAGASGISGSGAAQIGVSAAGAGVVPVSSEGSSPVAITAAALGTAVISGVSALSVQLIGTASGAAIVNGAGLAAAVITLNADGGAVSGVSGAVSAPVDILATIAGQLPLRASGSGLVMITTNAVGNIVVSGLSTAPIEVAIAATGVIQAAGGGSGGGAISIGLSAVGAVIVKGSGAGSLSTTLVATAAADTPVTGMITATLTVTCAAYGGAVVITFEVPYDTKDGQYTRAVPV